MKYNTHFVEIECLKFEVWEFIDWGKNPRWAMHETFDTIEEALDYIDDGRWEYQPFIEIREIEYSNYIEEYCGPEFEYD